MSEQILIDSAVRAWSNWFTAATLYYKALTTETRAKRREHAIRLGKEYLAAAYGVADPGIVWGVGEVAEVLSNIERAA